MGFRYLNQLASQDHINDFLRLADLAAGAGHDAGNVFKLSRELTASKPMELCERRLKKDPAAADLIAARRLCGPYDLDAMLQLPKGSLGHTYATVMQAMKYDIDFFPDPAFYNNLSSDADYINYRVYATHDIHHILSGFSLDNFGETGVISISIGQFSFPGFSFVNLISLMLGFFTTENPFYELSEGEKISNHIGYVFDMINHGIAIGTQAKPLFPVLWEERMAQNLDELREELEIEAVREGPWSWYSNPAITAALA